VCRRKRSIRVQTSAGTIEKNHEEPLLRAQIRAPTQECLYIYQWFLNCTATGGQIGKEVWDISGGSFVTIPAFASSDVGKPRDTSVKIGGVRKLPHTK
jgi:hypothetical protein